MVIAIALATSQDWASATTAIGTVAVAAVAVGVALFTERLAARRLQQEHKRSHELLAEDRALHQQEIAEERTLSDKRLAAQFEHRDAQLAEERTHLAAQLQKDRMWHRRADLYARTSPAMRRYIENRPTGPEGGMVSAADIIGLADLVSEATLLASKPLADLLNEFMYDFPDDDRQLEIWD